MSYHVKATFAVKAPLAKEAIREGLAHALWPDDDSVSFSGSTQDAGDGDCIVEMREGFVDLLFYREMGDDYPCVEDNKKYHGLQLLGALEALFMAELTHDGYAERLASAGLVPSSCAVCTKWMSPKDQANLSQAADEWVSETDKRAGDVQRVEAAAAEREDLKAYARVLARRGVAAERSWPPEVVAEYEAAAKAGVATRLQRVMESATGYDDLLGALNEAATYVKAVGGKA